jgi:prolyl-tRNA synthetase
MRLSKDITQTTKTEFKEASVISHQLLLRAGFMRQLSSGIYYYMPMLHRVLLKITEIVREEMNAKGAQELLLPQVMPRELWEETGRWEGYQAEGLLFTLKDRKGSEYCLGPTHEEAITDIARRELKSYKQLPVNLYQMQSKFRDEIRPRFGIMRGREFIMKDAYSFGATQEELDEEYEKMYDAYCRICDRCGFDYKVVDADSGAIGGTGSAEFMVLAETGEDMVLSCEKCEYAANAEKAESILEEFEQDKKEEPMKEVEGKGIVGVEKLAEFLKIPIWKTTKTLLFKADKDIVAVMVRGGCDVNEVKVKNHLGCKSLELADPQTVKKVSGADVGYAGPVNLPDKIRILADNYTKDRINFECGANKTNFHNINVNFDRDLPLDKLEFGDFKLAKQGDACIGCKKGKLEETRGIEMGHIFKLGTKYSESMGASFLDKDGKERPFIMGCYGIGISRIAAAAIEQSHDENGMIWPKNLAPYQIHLIGLNLEKEDVKKSCEELYEELKKKGYEVLYDDRDLQPGNKFADADLIGIPIRLTVSSRTMEEDKIEFKFRIEKDSVKISKDELLKELKNFYK